MPVPFWAYHPAISLREVSTFVQPSPSIIHIEAFLLLSCPEAQNRQPLILGHNEESHTSTGYALLWYGHSRQNPLPDVLSPDTAVHAAISKGKLFCAIRTIHARQCELLIRQHYGLRALRRCSCHRLSTGNDEGSGQSQHGQRCCHIRYFAYYVESRRVKYCRNRPLEPSPAISRIPHRSRCTGRESDENLSLRRST